MELSLAIYHNALHLFGDAELLFQNRRFPSSLALSILAIEEAGKFFVRRGNSKFNSEINIDRLHVPKQNEALSWLFVEEAIVTFFEVLEDYGLQHLPFEQTSPLQKKWLESTEGRSFQGRLGKNEVPRSIFNAVENRLKASSIQSDLLEATKGKLNKLKQSGFYVDEAKPQDPIGIPQDIGELEASKWLNRASRVVKLVALYAGTSTKGPFVTVPFDKRLTSGSHYVLSF